MFFIIQKNKPNGRDQIMKITNTEKTTYDCGHKDYEYTPILHEIREGYQILIGRVCLECGNDAEKHSKLRAKFLKTMRAKYLNGDISHADYYRSLYKSLCISMEGTEILTEAKEALDNGDEHLNTIPLAVWDDMASYTLNRKTAYDVFKLYGDSLTLAGLVCVYKQAVEDAVNKQTV